jgi:2,3-bisphosphoglycerate-independent phosphoglycerate mutase
MLNRPKLAVLLILDGFGYTLEAEYNAIAMANTPCRDQLHKDCPQTLLNCSGTAVGLPDGQMGSSEAGHVHIGTGRSVPQDFSKVNDAIIDGSFYVNPVLCRVANIVKEKIKPCISLYYCHWGGAHSHEEQIMAMVEIPLFLENTGYWRRRRRSEPVICSRK